MRGLKLLGILLLAALQLAWDLPAAYRTLATPAEEGALLDYVVIAVNGRMKKVSRGAELDFVRGDILKVINVSLKDPTRKINLVQIDGFKKADGSVEAREQLIDTSYDLIQKDDAVDPDGAVYALLTRTRGIVHGAVFLRRTEPTLGYIDVLINGKTRVMREGEGLHVKKSDHFKIVKFVTNIRENKDITFTVLPILEAKTKTHIALQNYQIVFRRKNRIFAKIPLTVENL